MSAEENTARLSGVYSYDDEYDDEDDFDESEFDDDFDDSLSDDDLDEFDDYDDTFADDDEIDEPYDDVEAEDGYVSSLNEGEELIDEDELDGFEEDDVDF
ncbi:MAG: hypothetical protein IJ191_05105 [Treponema sp.]|nr:hypothetical protein [Treponema sp.]